jgi:hypothetical protein
MLARYSPIVLAALISAAGCARSVTTADGAQLRLTSPEFRAYVERVFREQNRVATELAFAIEDAAGASSAELGLAEESLLSACAGLNRLATARRDELRLGAGERVGAAREAPRCESATDAAQAALERRAR